MSTVNIGDFKNNFDNIETGIDDLNNKITTLDNRIETIEDTVEDGLQKVQLNGKRVEEKRVFDALAINDTDLYSESIDLSEYSSFQAIIRHNLDQNPSVGYRSPGGANPAVQFVDGGWQRVASNEIEITEGANRSSFLNGAFPEFNRKGWRSINFRVSCEEAPTGGSLDLIIWGVK